MGALQKRLSPAAESARCLLCHDAPCTRACPHGCDPAAFLRGVRFGLGREAARRVPACDACGKSVCERACIHPDFPVRMTKVRQAVSAPPTPSVRADLSVDFCGIRCENPFFLSSSIVAGKYEMCA
ncbi:MAG: NAD-dependent dihydropyrimidine dehydrogenase subunit PreA, partial [Clostridiales bacterium]|nr:NAD-dependent dihydropyrimidine dehydrogenase subunit PreA [Clostridiales bacterium]